MRRIGRIVTILAALVPLWLIVASYTTGTTRLLVWLSPLIALVLFGAYLLGLLVVGVLTFRTVPEEAQHLLRDIAEARADLSKKGVLEEGSEVSFGAWCAE